MKNKIYLLTNKDLVETTKRYGLNRIIDEGVKEIGTAFRGFQNGKFKVIPRDGIQGNTGIIELMPCLSDKGYFLKNISYFPENPQKYGLPTIIGTIFLLDKDNGKPIVIADATYLTALRTGITSALATKYLAKEDSRVLGIIGTGAQAIMQAIAISRVRNLEKIIAYDKNIKNLFSFSRNIKKYLDCNIIEVSVPQEACLCDILVTATSNEKNSSIVKNEWVKQGTHINAIGSDYYEKVELEKDLLLNAKIVADYLQQTKSEGECQQLSEKDIYGELSEILVNKKNGRENNKEITVFDSTGVIIEDAVIFNKLMKLSKRYGFGKYLSLSSYKNPYNPLEV